MARDVGDLAKKIGDAAQQVAALAQTLLRLAGELQKEALAEGSSAFAACPYADIVAEWNARCGKVGMTRRTAAGTLQATMLRAWRAYPSMDLWRAAFDACARNEWWNGQGGGGWRGTLESFLRPVHYGKFFDEAVGAAKPVDEIAQPEGTIPFRVDPVEAEIDGLLADKDRRMPSGFRGLDPREVRGRDDQQFVTRVAALREYLSQDWRIVR